MKICTACNASYLDENLSFCPVDGTTLTPQKTISLEQVPYAYEMSEWSDDETAATEANEPPAARHSEPPPPAAFSNPASAPNAPQPAFASSSTSSPTIDPIYPVVIVGALILGVVGIFVMAGNFNESRTEVNSTRQSSGGITVAKPASSNAAASRGGITTGGSGSQATTNVATVTAPPSNAVAMSNTVGKPIPRNTTFTGIWQGEFGNEATVLSITSQNGDSFSGTLSKKGYVIKITGKVDFDKGTVDIKETQVLQTPPKLNWYLGNNEGIIADGGKSMSGTGKDKNSSYLWSFTKD